MKTNIDILTNTHSQTTEWGNRFGLTSLYEIPRKLYSNNYIKDVIFKSKWFLALLARNGNVEKQVEIRHTT